jgi:hypothetical protein
MFAPRAEPTPMSMTYLVLHQSLYHSRVLLDQNLVATLCRLWSLWKPRCIAPTTVTRPPTPTPGLSYDILSYILRIPIHIYYRLFLCDFLAGVLPVDRRVVVSSDPRMEAIPRRTPSRTTSAHSPTTTWQQTPRSLTCSPSTPEGATAIMIIIITPTTAIPVIIIIVIVVVVGGAFPRSEWSTPLRLRLVVLR